MTNADSNKLKKGTNKCTSGHVQCKSEMPAQIYLILRCSFKMFVDKMVVDKMFLHMRKCPRESRSSLEGRQTALL